MADADSLAYPSARCPPTRPRRQSAFPAKTPDMSCDRGRRWSAQASFGLEGDSAGCADI